MKPDLGKGATVTARPWARCVIAAVFLWIAQAQPQALALPAAPVSAAPSAPSTGAIALAQADSAGVPAYTDPGTVAREVLQGEDFWWKHIERKTVPTISVPSFWGKLLEYPLRFLKKVWEYVVDFLRWLYRMWRTLYGWIATGDWSGGADVIWLIAAVILGWAIWKLYPFVARWIRNSGAARGQQPVASVSWQSLPESSDLFAQAREAFADRKYAEAIRLALLALIARLEKQGLIRYDLTRTNREYQRELRAQADLAASFGQLARIYERVWYGRLPAGPAEAEEAIQLCRLLINKEDFAPE